jgi:hypothetical protein
VERGEIVHAVNEVTIAGSLADLFREIQAVGSDIDTRGGVRCGAVRVDGLTLAGGGSSANRCPDLVALRRAALGSGCFRARIQVDEVGE